ncbi:MAG: transposase [Actinobacteria bacterium]|nr:transposase [Actinomycetota bacterium]
MLSYKVHIAADAGGVITTVCVSPSALSYSAKASDLVEQHEKLLGTPAWIAADMKYGNQGCLGYLQAKGIKTVIEPASTNNRPGYFSKELFNYNVKHDYFLCPAGKILKRKSKNHSTNQIYYKAVKEDLLN